MNFRGSREWSGLGTTPSRILAKRIQEYLSSHSGGRPWHDTAVTSDIEVERVRNKWVWKTRNTVGGGIVLELCYHILQCHFCIPLWVPLGQPIFENIKFFTSKCGEFLKCWVFWWLGEKTKRRFTGKMEDKMAGEIILVWLHAGFYW